MHKKIALGLLAVLAVVTLLLAQDPGTRTAYIWVKDNASYGWNDYRYKHEWILVGKSKHNNKAKAASIMYG